MYRILGADGREYGPASADMVRAWIAEGRANASTRARPEGAADWRPLSDFPEFASSLTVKAPPAAASGGFGGQAQADAIAAEILARGYDLDIGSCLSRGWNLVFSNFWPIFGISLLAMLLLSVAGSIPFASFLLAYVIMGGLDWYFLKQIRGRSADISDLMAGFTLAFVPLMLFSLVGQLLTGIGYCLCIIPGIYLTVAWMLFTPLLIMDKRIEFWPAMELSRKVVSRHWWLLFGLLLAQIGLMLLGLIACCIGMLVAIPVATAMTVYAYGDIFNSQPPAGLPATISPVPAPGPAPQPDITPAPAPAPGPSPTPTSDVPAPGTGASPETPGPIGPPPA